tara:strand:- start:336 stop:593 length:258 start_codon:yes stop_codon:yes gene_type:complete
MTMSKKNYQYAVNMLNREMERTVYHYGSPIDGSLKEDNQMASHASRHTLFSIAAQMADNFEQDNPRFNRERFFSALNEDFVGMHL